MVHMMRKAVTEHQVRTRIRSSDHKRIVLFANRNDERVIDAYRTIIRMVLDHDGKIKPEADKTSVQLSAKTFKLLDERLENDRVDADVLIHSLLISSKQLSRKRTF